jgi:hypothetical protein
MARHAAKPGPCVTATVRTRSKPTSSRARRSSGATVRIFRHNDAAHLEQLLRDEDPSRARVVAFESVYSMDGDIAPIAELADVARRFFDEGWIDAPMRPAKRPGAFCAYTVPEVHPFLLLNWTSTRRDVLTLAHELGHGLHAYLARGQGIFHQSTPLTLAETASVFGETVTFGRILDGTTLEAAMLRPEEF